MVDDRSMKASQSQAISARPCRSARRLQSQSSHDKTRFAPDGFVIGRTAVLLPRMRALTVKEAFRQSIRGVDRKDSPCSRVDAGRGRATSARNVVVGLLGPEARLTSDKRAYGVPRLRACQYEPQFAILAHPRGQRIAHRLRRYGQSM